MSNLEQEMEFLFEAEEDNGIETAQETDDEFLNENNYASYGERFYEIASRDSEMSYEFESDMGEVLDDMEREYFWGGLKKLARKGFNKLSKKAMQMAGGNLKGLLKNAAKMGLNSVLPGSGAALSALGMEVSAEREAWDGFAHFSREAYENLAEEVGKTELLDPQNLGALTNVATKAFNSAFSKRKSAANSGGGRIHRISASKGDTIVIKVS
jgi:hypothetical protein